MHLCIEADEVLWSPVYACVCVCLSLRKITHELIYKFRPNSVGIGKGWPTRSCSSNVGVDLIQNVDQGSQDAGLCPSSWT